MGLIKTLKESVSSTLGDQFKEFVTCPQVDNTVLIVKGNVQHGKGNTNPSEGVISNGSVIVVPQGWAMMLIDNGKVEFSSEAGEYTYDTSSEPSIFYGGLGKGIVDTFKKIGSRFTFGGQTAKDQRVYYINLLTVPGNKFGSTSPKQVYDEFYRMTIKIQFRGVYAYRVDNPIQLVSTAIGGNPKEQITFEEIFGTQFKAEFNEQMANAVSKTMTEKKIKFSELNNNIVELSNNMNTILSSDWGAKYGIVLTDMSLEAVEATDEYVQKIQEVESKAFETRAMAQEYSDNMAGAMAAATSEAMKNAASNDGGAMMGFAGLNMAQASGNNILNTVAAMGTNNQAAANEAPAPSGNAQPSTPAEGSGDAPASAGVPNFCPNCGAKTNGANFCANCGQKLN